MPAAARRTHGAASARGCDAACPHEGNEKLNNELVASSHPGTNKTVSDEASKELEASSRLNLDLSLQLVASFNKEVSKELGTAPCRAPPAAEQRDHQAIMVSLSLASAARSTA